MKLNRKFLDLTWPYRIFKVFVFQNHVYEI